MLIDEFAERDRHFFFDCAGIVDVAGDAEQLGALVALASEAGEPFGAPSGDGGADGDGLDVRDGAGTAEEPDRGWERRL